MQRWKKSSLPTSRPKTFRVLIAITIASIVLLAFWGELSGIPSFSDILTYQEEEGKATALPIPSENSQNLTTTIENQAHQSSPYDTNQTFISLLGILQDVTSLPNSSNGLLQYSVTRSHPADGGTNGAPVATTRNYTVPPSMMVLDDKIVWCPNAKAGTTSLYVSIIFPMNFTTNKGMEYGARCFSDGCPISAWRILQNQRSLEEQKQRQQQQQQQQQQSKKSNQDDKNKWNGRVESLPSFTIVRNPWDRVRSCYTGKIASGRIYDLSDMKPGGKNKIIPKKNKRNPINETEKDSNDMTTPYIMTFVEFVNHISKYPNANVHWQPHSNRCLTSQFHYDYTIKLEHGLFPQIRTIFQTHNVSYPSGDINENINMKDPTKTLPSNNVSLAFGSNDEISKIQATATGTAAGDERLVEFYRQASSEAGMSLDSLVKKVRKIYENDILNSYEFPPY